MPDPLILHAMGPSPWSEKARWALDHHRLHYVEKEYTPMLGEAALRLRLRRPRGQLSVPLLLAGDDAYGDSLDIAQFAERHGGGPPLFRRGEEEEVARWNQTADRAMRAGRALMLERLAASGEAQKEYLPGLVPRPLRRPLAPVALVGVRYLQRKYRTQSGSGDAEPLHRADLQGALLELRAALADGRSTLAGELSFADIAMAAALQFVQPVEVARIQMAPAVRRAWTDLELAGEFNDLVAWRDQLYARWRGAAPRAA
jgi:glutathione S-transferase